MLLRTIAVIGAGTAGRSFARRCIESGFTVVLEDVMPAKLRRAQDEFADLSTHGSTGAIRYALTVEDAVADADLAIDFVPDELESKLEIFSLLDRMAPPRTILLTPTCALSITDLASCTYRSVQCIGLRADTGDILEGPVNIIRSRFASPEAVAAVQDFLLALHLPITIADDTTEPMLQLRAPGV